MMTTVNMKGIVTFLTKIMIVCAVMLVSSSCNDASDRLLNNDYGESGTNYETGKVLFIMIDGASGEAMREAYNNNNAPHIKNMALNSMYTFEGIADSKYTLDSMSRDRGWANLLTGVTTHDVGVGIEHVDDANMTTPSFLNLIKESNPDLKTSLYASNTSFYNAFSKGVDAGSHGSDDEFVKNSVINELGGSGVSSSDIIVAQFSGVDIAGKENGFYDMAGDPTLSVINAIKKVDEYIGNIIGELRARPNFVKENWLVIVTSTYGGDYDGLPGDTYYDDLERNTFTLMYNSRFASGLLQRPVAEGLSYNYFSPYYSGSGATSSASVQDASLFNMVKDSSYTIQFMVYDSYNGASGAHTLVSKCEDGKEAKSTIGYKMWFTGNNVRVSSYSLTKDSWITSGTSETPNKSNYSRKNRRWDVFTFVFETKLGRLLCYCNGVLYRNNVPLTNMEMINGFPLTIGKIKDSATSEKASISITNLQFYDVALPTEFIAENYCKTRIDEINGYKYWDNLLGYWPNDREEDFKETVLKDYSKYGSVYGGVNAGKSDMTINGPAYWAIGNKVETNVCPGLDNSFYRGVFNTVDIAYQTMQWLGASIDSTWKLEGIGWPPKYSYFEKD